MTAATSLLDFILRLLKDPQAQAEFRASPEQVLAANGLTGVSAADIRDTLPLVTDNRFVGLNSSHTLPPSVVPSAGDSGVHAAIRYLRHITTTYRYDDHGTHAHDPGHGNIWATGDVPQSFDHGHGATGDPHPGPGGAPGTGNWGHHSQWNSGRESNPTYGDHSNGLLYSDTQDGRAASSSGSEDRHSGHYDDGLHSFGSGAATTSASGTGSPGAYPGNNGSSHDSTSFHHADFGGTASQAGPEDHHTHDAHSGLGDSYYGHDSYYGQGGEHGAYDGDHGTQGNQEPHIYLDLH
jgi:hypothetical protein